jgi:hypothetical protein
MVTYTRSPIPFSKQDTYNIWPGGVDPTTIKSVRVHGGRRKTYKKRRNNKKTRKHRTRL